MFTPIFKTLNTEAAIIEKTKIEVFINISEFLSSKNSLGNNKPDKYGAYDSALVEVGVVSDCTNGSTVEREITSIRPARQANINDDKKRSLAFGLRKENRILNSVKSIV